MRPMESLQDLIDEAKARTLLWVICIYALTYFLTHTSKSMWMNIPISVLILAAFRYLSFEVELRWRVPPINRQSYLSRLSKKQLSVKDYRLSAVPAASKWRRKIDSPHVEAAIDAFINKILQDFVVDLWYSSITPDKEAPELIRSILLDVLGEISGRVKEINLVDLLTRDVIDLVGNQLDLYRKSQSDIGIDVMGTLSFEERDERLKQHLMASKELHPALISAESEHKVLQRIVGGILALVMKPQESKCPLVRCISRELLACLVIQPVINLASPAYINELIEYIFLANKDNGDGDIGSVQDPSVSVGDCRSADPDSRRAAASSKSSDLMVFKSSGKTSLDGSKDGQQNTLQKDSSYHVQPRPADWALVLEAATKRRSQVLAPENLENMWTKGRNYKKKSSEFMKAGNSSELAGSSGKELVTDLNERTTACENERRSGGSTNSQLKRSSSTPDMSLALMNRTGEKQEPSRELISHYEEFLHVPKLRCRVVGAYFEKTGSQSFAVYSIAVTDAENKTWFVKRRHAIQELRAIAPTS
ncbi:uncharacterized protein M6B38_357065 [Iris pallida]|uniref:PXA domain-containing protein n=1 Tax=Iris pallida TaxID=29817 RepID=A0AAX6EJ71_IRIPA|nr:uncharacterized protein M6B38_186820 [Iris pallida]KAJ6829611.1 uncharacterized protein M6B38_357065 [Iris pallida]